MTRRQSSARAFTLVELLVVIGIIALLISMLLPSLTKARQSANLLDCQMRLRQMGAALQIYSASNKGYLPWGAINRSVAWMDHNPQIQEDVWWWPWTLSESMGQPVLDPTGHATRVSKVFTDRDTIDGHGSVPVTWVSHYTANPRVLVQNERDDGPAIMKSNWSDPTLSIPGSERVTPKTANIKHPSNVFVIWDGPQARDEGGNAYGIASAIDAWGQYNHGLYYDTPFAGFVYDRAIIPGQLGVTGRQDGKAFQRKYNIDLNSSWRLVPDGWYTHLRFRHMNNNRLAALCADGHVETRAVGTVMVKDLLVNFK